ncbi:MAG: PQQ-dependent sugar dehydrogenase [Acidobacteriota bacterium]
MMMPLTVIPFLFAACQGGAAVAPAPSSDPGELTCDPANGGVTLPEGFCALVVADNLGRARHLQVTESGDIYVRFRETEDARGGVVGLRDTDGDGRADLEEWFADHYGTGIEVHDGYLYVSTDTSVLRYRIPEGQLAPGGEPETVIEGFPPQRQHRAKPFAFDDEGLIYVTVGAPSNAGQEQSRTKGAPGMRPCPQLERQAGIWRFDANRTGLTQEQDGHRYATGIRHAVAIAWDATSRAGYVVQHGRDQLHALWPEHFTSEQNAKIPAEELLALEEGADYMWPYCYFDPLQGKKLLAPEYGGDGKKVGDCGKAPEPLVAFPGHWAPNDSIFYTGKQFPERYRGGAFIAFHGSWNRAPLPQGGYNVVFVPMKDGRPSGDWEVFAKGFAGQEPLASPRDARFRPMGLAQGPDGSLYVSDSVRGRIWRIMYKGG